MKYIKMPISEVADRYSIVLLKSERTEEDLSAELELYKDIIDGYGSDLILYTSRLYDINGQIWDLESDVRKGKEKELGLEEVGRRAINIRELNKVRVGIKNEIVEKYGEGFKDIKINHASA